eukprot:g7445.t1
MMQKMSEKIEEEGETEKDLYDKFMCHCKSELADFNKGKAAFEAAVPKLESDISATEAQISQLTQEIEAKRADEVATKDSMQRASVEREKDLEQEHDVYVDDVTVLKADIGAISEALPVLEEATAGAFVQTGSDARRLGLSKKQVDRLQQVVSKSKSATESERQAMASFLATGKTEDICGRRWRNPQGIGEIKGMLEVQKEDLQKEVVVDDKEEEKEVNIFEELMNAKTEEKETIEEQFIASSCAFSCGIRASCRETLAQKIDRLGALKVSLVEKKGELKDSQLPESTTVLLQDAQNALSKDFDVLKKLSETCEAKTKEWSFREKSRGEELIAIGETVKILNSDDNLGLFKKALPSPSLLQLGGSRHKALGVLKGYASSLGSKAVGNRTNVDLVMLALSNKGVDFSSVMSMIDNMTVLMEQEQKNDDEKKAYCNKQTFETKRKTKALRHKIQTLEQAVLIQEEAIASTSSEIEELQKGVTKLDKSESAPALVQVEAHISENEPPSFGSAKSVQGNRVLTMLEGLVTETEKTLAEAESNEKESQRLYEDMLVDAQAKREADVKAIASKQKAKASAETEKVKKSDSKTAEKEELKDVQQYGAELKEEKPWLLANYETRKTARAQEKESLTDAKAALAGAK